jgi:hypothetical protein
MMKPTTVTTCENNIPNVRLFVDEGELDAAKYEHYSDIWKRVCPDEEIPATWQEMKSTLEALDLIMPCDIMHIQEHSLYREQYVS